MMLRLRAIFAVMFFSCLISLPGKAAAAEVGAGDWHGLELGVALNNWVDIQMTLRELFTTLWQSAQQRPQPVWRLP